MKAILSPTRRERRSEPSVRRVKRRERDAGDRRRQSERQVDGRVEQALSGKAIARQSPGDRRADQRGYDGGGPSATPNETPSARCDAWLRRNMRNPVSPRPEALSQQGAERDDDDEREVERGNAERQSEAWNCAPSPRKRQPCGVALKVTQFAFWNWSKTPPSAKNFACACFQPPKFSSTVIRSSLGNCASSSFAAEFGMDRAEVVLGDDRLRFGRIQKVEIGFGGLARAFARRRCRRQATTGGSARIENDGVTISNWSLPNSLERQERVVLPGDQHVAQASLREGDCRAARARVEHGRRSCRSRRQIRASCSRPR